ncbi:MAG: MBL fold metallo-hydrolase RNA specificity domain-containing protein [Bacillota bacterium]
MRLTFLGAAGMVTGSCYLLEAGGLRLLVDCGLFQGKEEDLNTAPFPFHPATLDGVVLTHAHIDHSGRLPLLRKRGFTGPIYTHPATIDLARIMLMDSAHIQETETERENRRNKRSGKEPKEPLYTQADAAGVGEQFVPVPYGEMYRLSDRLKVRLQDAGHILGSAILEFFETGPDGQSTKLVFSGDLGQPGRPILRDPAIIEEADYLVLESTYGNRMHEPVEDTRAALADVVRSTIAKGGNVIIPAFAVGRTQEVLYELNALIESGQVDRRLKVVVDSPLAIAATQITSNHSDLFDEAAARRLRGGDDPLAFPGLFMSETAEQSMQLNNAKEPMVIVAASGMCEAGRVVHHLKHNLWRPVSTILFVGFQAQGTLGRRLVDGANRVRIFGEEVAVKARVEVLHGFSAHADQAQLLAWVKGLKRPPRATFLVHGEDEPRGELAQLLIDEGHQVALPVLGESLSLTPAELKYAHFARPEPGRKGQEPRRVAAAAADSLSVSARQMSALLREVDGLRKQWYANGPHLPAAEAEEVARRAEELNRLVQQLHRLIAAAKESR